MDQDRIGLMIFTNFEDKDWILTEKLHSPLISGKDQRWPWIQGSPVATGGLLGA